MSNSCTLHHHLAPSARRCSDDAGPKNFLFGLAVSVLIWASLAVGTILITLGS